MRLWQLLSLGRRAIALADAVNHENGTQRVVVLDERAARAIGQHGHTVVRAHLDAGRLRDVEGTTDGVCLGELGGPEAGDPIALLLDCSRVVRGGGFVMAASPTSMGVDHAASAKLAAWFLHAGLVDLKQERRRGVILTSGRVRRG